MHKDRGIPVFVGEHTLCTLIGSMCTIWQFGLMHILIEVCYGRGVILLWFLGKLCEKVVVQIAHQRSFIVEAHISQNKIDLS